MALKDAGCAFVKHIKPLRCPTSRIAASQCRRYATTQAIEESDDLEHSTFIENTTISDRKYDPVERARRRNKQLPRSRYQYRPPKYYRGPLHPHQPPPASDAGSREFVPGPFSAPRLQDTYHDTIASDLMTLSYHHFPPGTESVKKSERLRSWVGDSPYFKNRPLRGPRGGEVLRLLRKPIIFNNIPRLERVTLHTMVAEAANNSGHLHCAGMVMQAITSVRAKPHKMRAAAFGVKQNAYVSVTCELTGENMYHFLSKLIDVVLPKIKDWKGVKGSTGDNSGNLSFGLTSDDVAMFPEIEVNYDSYPPNMIPGCNVTIHTSAATDSDARMLLNSIGIPFYGKLID